MLSAHKSDKNLKQNMSLAVHTKKRPEMRNQDYLQQNSAIIWGFGGVQAGVYVNAAYAGKVGCIP